MNFTASWLNEIGFKSGMTDTMFGPAIVVSLSIGSFSSGLLMPYICVLATVFPVVSVSRSHIRRPFSIPGERISSIPFLSGVSKLWLMTTLRVSVELALLVPSPILFMFYRKQIYELCLMELF